MYLILTIAAFATSLISGVLSMAGGMILMGIFGFLLSVPAAMVLHGVTQAVSNGSRIWLYRRYIRWPVLLPYTIGASICLGLFVAIQMVPSKSIVFITIGIFPFVALSLPKSINLNIESFHVAGICGFVVTLAQMLAGASGPILDIFYLQSKLNRFEILGTKAITQTLGHLIKLGYYGFFLTLAVELPLPIYPAVIVASLLGVNLGKQILTKLTDDQFKRIGRVLVLIIGAIYVVKGVDESGMITFLASTFVD